MKISEAFLRIKKYLMRFWFKSKPIEQLVRSRKFGFLSWKIGAGKLGLLHLAIPALIGVAVVGTVVTQVPSLRLAAFQFSKPKPITQSTISLAPDIQLAIQNLASQEIKTAQANANLAINSNLTQASQSGLIQPLIDSILGAFTTNPIDKAKLRLKNIDRQIIELQTLLEKDKSDKAVDKAVSLIKTIGQETGQVVSDPKAQSDREVLTTLIQQYNRLQLVIQKVEDQLPVTSYLKIDDARENLIEKGARDFLNSAPNLDVVNNIGIKEVSKIVGSDFAELKAIELLSSIETGLNPDTKVKLAGLEKELALQFEKRMLTLAPDVRYRKLQDYIKYSYGNPLNQVQAFSRMQQFLTDRDLILGVASLKELSLQKLEGRVFELNTPQLIDQFSSQVSVNPEAIDVLAQMKMDTDSGADTTKKQIVNQLLDKSIQGFVATYGKDKNTIVEAFPDGDKNGSLIDVLAINRLDQVMSNSSGVSTDVKQAVKDAKQKILHNFITNIAKTDFITTPKLIYNPVPANADVRVLLPAPQTFTALENIKSQLSDQDKPKIAIAQKATSTILASHLLLQVNDPAIFEKYQQFITDNPQVKQTIQNNVGQNFFVSLAQKKKLIDKQSQVDQQALYGQMQQIVQEIFVGNDKNALKDQLPQNVQDEIGKLKGSLADNAIPQLEVPADVKLSSVASLPSDVQDAIIQSARQQIQQTSQPISSKLDIVAEAKDLGISVPTILPDSPFYPIVQAERILALVTKTDPIDKAEELLKQDNEKTLEAAILIEENHSTQTIETAIKTLASVAVDFDLLKDHAGDLKSLEVTESQRVDILVNDIIDDGLNRQTILSTIENNIYGDQYVAVEKIRADELKDGIDVLLQVTDNNVQKLTDQLEKTVTSSQSSPVEEIKGVELLNEIARTQPEIVQQTLQQSEASISTSLEKTLLTQTPEQRSQELLRYAENATGNPVRQLEAYDIIKDNFTNPETILLAETLKDAATQNLEERISEIPDATTRQDFVDNVIGSEPQDLKAAIEIEVRVEPPANSQVEQTPIQQQVAEIVGSIEQNIVTMYQDKPAELKNADFFDNQTLVKTPDIIDIKVAQDLNLVLSQAPEVQPEVVLIAKAEEHKIVETFVENISQPQFQASNSAQVNKDSLVAQTLNPVPETLALLVELKQETPPAIDIKIDAAIKIEVALIEEYLTTQVNDPQTFETYLAQIQQNPVVAQVVEQVGGTQFTQAVDQKAQELAAVAAQDQTQLTNTVSQIQQEIFSTPVNQPSAIEQTLPQTIQDQIQQIKTEVPVDQIPAIIVSATVETTPTATPQPITTPEPISQPIVAPLAPAPAAPEVQPPTVTEPAPIPAVGL